MDKQDRPKLDWVSGHDPRSKNFTFYGAAPKESLEPIKPKFWRPGIVLNQGKEGSCVGMGWTGELLATPHPFTEKILGEAEVFAHKLYQTARAHDRKLGWHWPAGASVIGGARSVRDMGHIGEFRWCMSPEEVRDAVINEGPVVIGIPWREGMYQTRPSGLVEVSGKVVGGHCLTLTGYHPAMRIRGEDWSKRYEVFRWINSWGVGYGKRGMGLIKAEDLAVLLKGQGEACVPMGRKPVRKL